MTAKRYVYQALSATMAMLVAGTGAAWGATATGQFTAQITIEGECIVATTNTLNFGTTGVLSENIDQTASFQVQCTNSTPYTVGLAGTGSGATTSVRKMTGSAGTVDYQMFSDPSRTVNWGDAVTVDTVDGTGNGAPQSLTIYGRIIAQTTPEPGTYTDTVTIEVTY